MNEAVIIYHSKTGTTKKYAEDIGKYLKGKGVGATITSTYTFSEEMLDNVEYIFFGCWTSGLFIMRQTPELSWVEFAGRLPEQSGAKVALFTTYKILTGSMFRNMCKELEGKFAPPTLELKSRSQFLTEKNKQDLDRFVS